ncbi:DUF7619 domain-containing protein [Aureivirga marina]|uniref:DUF7619 domain-containing protein n=1 Tax=Aureivirga marina TaxID=1182451 RepID=UPI0018CAC6E8|nr:T9SS type A sorting domain-containing protein [Aureivirga marina]
MKKKYVLILALLVNFMAFSQITFTDANFENALVNEICVDTDGDGMADATADTDLSGDISTAEAQAITWLEIVNQDITNIDEIDEFTNLEYLNLSDNDIPAADFSSNTTLTNLRLSSNKFANIDLSALVNLEYLYVGFNQLTDITLGNFTELKTLSLPNNSLSTIDLSDFDNLLKLDISQNELTTITLTNLVDLQELSLFGNALTTITLTNNNALNRLNLKENQLASVNLANLTGLVELDLSSNQLVNVNLATNTALNKLSINDNQLTNVTVTGLAVLEELYLSSNQISTINLSSNPDLKNLGLANNNLNTLDLSSNPALISLGVSENNLAVLDLSSNPVVETIYADENNLTNINVTNCTVLERLYAKDNQLAAIDLSNNTALEILNLRDNFFVATSVLDLTNNINLEYLNLQGNNFTNLDLTQNVALEELILRGNAFTTIDLSANINLKFANLKSNDLTDIDLTNNINLQMLDIAFNELLALDVSANTQLSSLFMNDNDNLTTLFIKNGIQVDFGDDADGLEDLSLIYVCADEANLTYYEGLVLSQGYTDCSVNDFCSYDPLSSTYKLQGNVSYDFGADGCDATDTPAEFLKFEITNGTDTFYLLANQLGNYNIPLEAGTYTITPIVPNTTYFEVTPTDATVTFPNAIGDEITENFCITPLGDFDDFEVTIVPLTVARPGARAKYKIIYKNQGTTSFTGDLNFTYQSNLMTYDTADTAPDSNTGGVIQWNLVDFAPFSTGEITVEFILNTPTDATNPVNQGDILNYTADMVDGTSANVATFTLAHEVQNSFDPNDKRCLEGKNIGIEQIGDYLTYMIRFENTGNAHALNIVVEDVIDVSKFDISTLRTIDASHTCQTFIEGNLVKFVFDDILLHWEDDKNDGYVVFKIKTLDTLQISDVIENTAEIYFDYNEAIVTNTAQTTIGTLGVDNLDLDTSIAVYPNPASNVIHISADNNLKEVSIFNVLGNEVYRNSIENSTLKQSVSLENLTSGVYFIKVKSVKGNFLDKLIIR